MISACENDGPIPPENASAVVSAGDTCDSDRPRQCRWADRDVAGILAESESAAHRRAIQDRLKAHRPAAFIDVEGTIDPGTVPDDAKYWRP